MCYNSYINTQTREFIMNTKHLISTGILFASMFGFTSHANASYMYANSLSINKISTIQDSIIRTAMHTFSRTPTAVMSRQQQIISNQSVEQTNQNTPDMYGHAPMYGTAPMYGEFEAHEFAGRSGGETELADIKTLQLGYSHYDTKVKFDNFERTASDYDMLIFGLTDGYTHFMDTTAAWAIYAGLVNGNTSANSVHIDEFGGYAGLYGRIDMNNFGLAASFNGGALSNEAKHEFDSDDYTNMWAGAGVNATYNINLDNTFVLQPGIYLGYTWIKSGDYLSDSGFQISNTDANVFEVSPSLHAIKHINNGWYGTAHVRYVKTSTSGDEITINKMKYNGLTPENFVEYGLSLEKSVERFTFSGTILRRDIGQDGWGGNLNIKYIF